MPFYRFTIILRDGSNHTGIRQLTAIDLNYVWRTYERKAKDHYKSKLASFDVIQLSKLSKEVKEFIKSQGKKEEVQFSEWSPMANRKKTYKEGKTLEDRKALDK